MPCWKNKWAGLILYLSLMFLTTPFLPQLEIFISGLLHISVARIACYVKFISILGIIFFLIWYIVSRQRYQEKSTYFALCLMGILGYFTVGNLSVPIEAVHLAEYSGLSLVAFYTLRKGKQNSSLLAIYLKAGIITVMVGIIDEIYQGILPTRYYDFNDIVTNAASGLLGFIFLVGIVKPQTNSCVTKG